MRRDPHETLSILRDILQRTPSHGGEEARALAAEVVGMVGDPGAIEPLLVPALLDWNAAVRDGAVKALIALGPSAFEPVLALLSHTHPWVRSHVATALGGLGDRRAVDALIRSLGDAEGLVANSAARALGAIGDERALGPLRVAAKKPKIGWYAEEALARIERPGESAPPRASDASDASDETPAKVLSPDEVAALFVVLKDPRHRARRDAMLDLVACGGPDIIQGFLSALALGEPVTSSLSADALGRLEAREAVAPLIAQSGALAPKVRASVASALGDLGDPSAIEALSERVRTDTAWDVRLAAILALARLKDDRAFPALIFALQHEKGKAGQEAVGDALVSLGAPAVKALCDLLDGESPEGRQAACNALGRLGDRAAIPALRRELAGKRKAVSVAAADALGLIGGEEASRALIARLDDKRPEVLASVVRALGTIADPGAIDPLIALLPKATPDARGEAITALSAFVDPRILPAVLPYLLAPPREGSGGAPKVDGRIGLAVARLLASAWKTRHP